MLNRQFTDCLRYVFTWAIYRPEQEVSLMNFWKKLIPLQIFYFNEDFYCGPEILQAANILMVDF